MKDWYVYIVECIDGSYYTGCTVDLVRRFIQHNSGDGSKYVKSAGGIKVGKWIEILNNRSDAQKLESRIKSLSRIKKEKLIKLSVKDRIKWLQFELII